MLFQIFQLGLLRAEQPAFSMSVMRSCPGGKVGRFFPDRVVPALQQGLSLSLHVAIVTTDAIEDGSLVDSLTLGMAFEFRDENDVSLSEVM